MQWRNKGHEFDQFAKELIQIFQKKNCKIYIFGAGYWGIRLKNILEQYSCFSGFIDNDEEKQKQGVDGEAVYSLDEYMKNLPQGLIVIAVDKKNINAIKEQLMGEKLQHSIDFYEYGEFTKQILPVISFYHYKKMYVELAQICVTERCTLNCEKCAHGCYNVSKSASDMPFDEVKKSADSFFEKVDLIEEFVLIGGEPLLYKQLADAIEYIGQRYRSQMIIFSITTNGTIIPSEEILKKCKKYNVLFRISNYSESLPYMKDKYKTLCNILSEHGIEYTIGPEELIWMDYGFEYFDRGTDEKQLCTAFDECRTPCREIRGNKYYYCVMARSVSDNLNFNLGQDDYLDMDEIDIENRAILMEYEMGYSQKGYLEMCRYCRGGEAANYPIPAAIQAKLVSKE